ncbi:MAG: type 4a pilus biogenesis protein PilO [Patescibacteria group bacterium]
MAFDHKDNLAAYRRYLKTMEEKPGLRDSAFLILSLILVIFLSAFALRPTLVTVASLFGQIREQKMIANQLNKKIQNLQVASDLMETEKERLALLNQALPNTPNVSQWVESVQQLSIESGVVVESLSLGNTVFGRQIQPEKIEVVKTNFSISISGDYDQVESFVTGLEDFLRITIVTDLRLSRNQEGQLSANVKGAIAYEKK